MNKSIIALYVLSCVVVWLYGLLFWVCLYINICNLHKLYKYYTCIYVYFSSLKRTHLGGYINKVSKVFLMQKP